MVSDTALNSSEAEISAGWAVPSVSEASVVLGEGEQREKPGEVVLTTAPVPSSTRHPPSLWPGEVVPQVANEAAEAAFASGMVGGRVR